MGTASQQRPVVRRREGLISHDLDHLTVESPLEISLNGTPLAVVMRTPGDDAELIMGFALTEGILLEPSELASLGPNEHDPNRWLMTATVDIDASRFQRNFYATSSCGVCGKASINAVRVAAGPVSDDFEIPWDLLASLPQAMSERQSTFADTGGLHAAALFDNLGEMAVVREDIGRHNAVDKVVGAVAPHRWRDPNLGLLVSGRISFEIVQKAAVAGIGLVVGVSAASSLAIDLATELGLTVVGFLRGEDATAYCGPQRIR